MTMKTLTIIALALTAALMVGCKNSTIHNHEQIAIDLNNGQKWKVNDEMSPYILAGENILSNFSGEDYQTLADELEGHNKKLIKSCNMNGKAHDQLHKWLHPHMQLIASLQDAENSTQAMGIIERLNESFKTYHTYFQ